VPVLRANIREELKMEEIKEDGKVLNKNSHEPAAP